MSKVIKRRKPGAGRPTPLDEELKRKIRTWVHEGNKLEEIAILCDIPYETIRDWKTRNYLDFSDDMRVWKMEARLMKAEENIDDALTMETKSAIPTKDGDFIELDDPRKMKIKIDTSTFVAETLGKQFYSKRNEVTGKDGKDLIRATPEMVQEYLAELESKPLELSEPKQ